MSSDQLQVRVSFDSSIDNVANVHKRNQRHCRRSKNEEDGRLKKPRENQASQRGRESTAGSITSNVMYSSWTRTNGMGCWCVQQIFYAVVSPRNNTMTRRWYESLLSSPVWETAKHLHAPDPDGSEPKNTLSGSVFDKLTLYTVSIFDVCGFGLTIAPPPRARRARTSPAHLLSKTCREKQRYACKYVRCMLIHSICSQNTYRFDSNAHI
jgi:hypothetical protein